MDRNSGNLRVHTERMILETCGVMEHLIRSKSILFSFEFSNIRFIWHRTCEWFKCKHVFKKKLQLFPTRLVT